MNNLLNPKWLFLLNTLPVVVLLILLGGEYSVIHTLLQPENQQVWQVLGAGLSGLGLVQTLYAGWMLHTRRTLPTGYALVALAVYVAFLYGYVTYLNKVFPFDIPRWMVPSDMPLYVGTFLMPTLAHAALVLLIRLTPDDRPHRALPNFGIALAIPLGTYLFVQLLLPLWQFPHNGFGGHVLTVLFVAGTVTFLFFLARGTYVLLTSRAGIWATYQLLWKTIIAVIMPLLGLAVNNGVLFNLVHKPGEGVFGNFTGPWFYGWALLNGVLLCLPSPDGKWGRLALFVGRGITLAYTLYFFLVFLPFLPLSVVAVLVIGVGFLMLTPLLLLLVHLRELGQDFSALRSFFSHRVLIGILFGSVAVLPLYFTGSYWYQRRVLHQALATLYIPDYNKVERVDEAALTEALAQVRAHKDDRHASFSTHLPYLSMYFNWIVLDNLMLSDEKLNRLEQVFTGQVTARQRHGFPPPTTTLAPESEQPQLTALTTRSNYNVQQQAWTSWVDLELTNSTGVEAAEYSTTLDLPAGCWVQEYYLDIAGRREKGILAEKKAATWVFSQIRNEQRDPGILYYLAGNRVALRVFPFGANEVRRTGIRLIHKEPVALRLANREVLLGDVSKAPLLAAPLTTPGGEVTYLSATVKSQLPLVRRQPYVHFLLDASQNSKVRQQAYARQIEAFLHQYPAMAANARYSLVNSSTIAVPANQRWHEQLAEAASVGGFYVEGGLRQILYEAQQQPKPTYPVVVALTDSLERAILPTDLSEYQKATPEQQAFYVLTTGGELVAYSLGQTKPIAQLTPNSLLPPAVRAWPNVSHPRAYLPDDSQASIVLTTSHFLLPDGVGKAKSWQDGLWLQGQQLQQTWYPAAAEASRLPAIQASFRSGIMTPLTSYLALENEAQKAALRRKQEQVLASNAALDLEENAERMSEPELWVVLALLAAWGLYRQRRLHAATA